MMPAKILIIEDEARMRRLLQLMLEDKGFEVKTAGDGDEGISLWRKWHPDVVLTDLKMPGTDGMGVLDFKNRHRLTTPLIVLTAFGTIDSAVAAVKKGAFDYLAKPVENERVEETIQRALAVVEEQEYREQPFSNQDKDLKKSRMIGSSSAMQKIREAIQQVAPSPTTVLITGESGVGKELVANAIHVQSNRAAGPFVRINCPAIPKDLLETELFGHQKGAFTGAVKSRLGAFQKADGGTLFLDEIGDLPLELQPKLLHAVEEKTISPIGSADTRTMDVRIVAATNQDLPAMVEGFRFRSDLYFRLNAFHIHVPPLRERSEDIPDLAAYLIEQYARSLNRPTPGIRPDGLQLLKRYAWPGNIRELRNVMERCVLTVKGNDLAPCDMPDHLCSFLKDGIPKTSQISSSQNPFDLQANEKQAIIDALQQTRWNQSRAAKLLNITRNTLRYRIKKLNIQQMD